MAISQNIWRINPESNTSRGVIKTTLCYVIHFRHVCKIYIYIYKRLRMKGEKITKAFHEMVKWMSPWANDYFFSNRFSKRQLCVSLLPLVLKQVTLSYLFELPVCSCWGGVYELCQCPPPALFAIKLYSEAGWRGLTTANSSRLNNQLQRVAGGKVNAYWVYATKADTYVDSNDIVVVAMQQANPLK